MTGGGESIAVVGAGSWGTALAVHLSRIGHDVRLWGRDGEIVERIAIDRENPSYLAGVRVPDRIIATTDMGDALAAARFVVFAVPSHGLRAVAHAASGAISKDAVLVSATKGIEPDSLRRMSEVLAHETGDARPIVDGGECLPFDKVLAIAAGQQAYTPKVESTIKLDGRYGIVEDLQIQCGFRYNVFARGLHNIIRRNIIRGAYEDSIKNTSGADYGLVADNDIAGFVSQGLDHFGANHWLVTRNVFHDPGRDPNSGIVVGNGITVKGAARNVVITRNTVRRFLTNPDQGAITLGAPAALVSSVARPVIVARAPAMVSESIAVDWTLRFSALSWKVSDPTGLAAPRT